jgi:hypothetical protein
MDNSRKNINPLIRYSLVAVGGILILLFIFFLIGGFDFSGLTDKKVTRAETKENFSKHEKDIMYFSDLLMSEQPPNHEVSLSLNGHRGSISIALPAWSVDPRFPIQHFEFSLSDVDDNSSFLKPLRWDLPTFNKIIESFRKTNCESANTNGGYIILHYKTGTWISFFYNVNPTPISDSLRKIYDSADIPILNPRVTIGSTSAL